MKKNPPPPAKKWKNFSESTTEGVQIILRRGKRKKENISYILSEKEYEKQKYEQILREKKG